MKPEELRIGNWVYSTKFRQLQSPCRIVWITDSGVKVDHKGYVDSERIENIQPIPLTPQWLERFGFKESDFGVSKYGWQAKRYSLGDFVILYIPHKSKDGVFIHEATNTRIPFIHRLQNLYYALTEEELTESNPGS